MNSKIILKRIGVIILGIIVGSCIAVASGNSFITNLGRFFGAIIPSVIIIYLIFYITERKKSPRKEVEETEMSHDECINAIQKTIESSPNLNQTTLKYISTHDRQSIEDFASNKSNVSKLKSEIFNKTGAKFSDEEVINYFMIWCDNKLNETGSLDKS